MRPGLVWAVAHREVLATLRDHRAVLANLLIPLVVLPLVMLGLPLLLGGLFGREALQSTTVGAEGLERLPPAFVQTLKRKNIKLISVKDAEQAVRADEVTGAFRVPQGFTAKLRAGTAPLVLYRKSGGLRDELLSEKLTGAVETFQKSLVRQRIERAGLGPGVLTPIRLETRDASTPAERASGSLGWLIPFFVMIWTLTGGQMVAIDATAGEKERGTLEALLVAPVRRSEVVVGKFFATLLFGLSAASVALVGFLGKRLALKRHLRGAVKWGCGGRRPRSRRHAAGPSGGAFRPAGKCFTSCSPRRGAAHRHHAFCTLIQGSAELRRAARARVGVAGREFAIFRLFRLESGRLCAPRVRHPSLNERHRKRSL